MNLTNVTKVNVIEKVTEAAKKAGAIYPEAVAEYLKDNLVTVDSLSGPQVLVRTGLECEPLDFVMSRMKVTENVGALFNGGALNVRTLDHDLYRAIRKHAPTLVKL